MRAAWPAGWGMALILTVVGDLTAQSKEAEPGPPPKAEKKDPTQPSPKLRDVLDGPKLGPGAAAALPSIVLRGRIITEGQPPAVLLELDAKQLPIMVSEGSAFGIGSTKFQVLAVTMTEVRIEIGSGNEVLILR